MSFNFMAAVTIHGDFWNPTKTVTESTLSPSICQEVMETDAMFLRFLNAEF